MSLAQYEEVMELRARGLGHRRIAAATGVPTASVRNWTERGHVPRDTVSPEPLREAFGRTGLTVYAVALLAEMDWTQCARVLGQQKYHRHGKAYDVTAVTYTNALRIAEALGCDPVDVGL